MDKDRAIRLAEAGRWLRQQREQRGYTTARAFATALGIDASLVSNYERGVYAVDDQRAAQIAETLGIPELVVREHLGLWVPAAGVPSAADLASIPEESILRWAEQIAESYPDSPAIQQSVRLLATLVSEHTASTQDHDEEGPSQKTG